MNQESLSKDQFIKVISAIKLSEEDQVLGIDDVAVVGPSDMRFMRLGCVDGKLTVLSEPERFEGWMHYSNPKAVVNSGTHVFAVNDIKPFDSVEPITDPCLKIEAKLMMTRDFFLVLSKALELDPALEMAYVFTNKKMATFMCKHWGFRLFGVENAPETIKASEDNASFALYASVEDMEAKYDHLVEYVAVLQKELATYK